MQKTKTTKKLIQKQRVNMCRRSLKFLQILYNKIIYQRIVISKALNGQFRVEELCFIHLWYTLCIIEYRRIRHHLAITPHPQQYLYNIAPPRVVVVANRVENAVRLVLHIRYRVDALFLNSNAEVVSILHLGDSESNPHLDCTAQHYTLPYLFFQEI